MSLSNTHILPNLYNSLATPPLSPVISAKQHHSGKIRVNTACTTPITSGQNSPLISPRMDAGNGVETQPAIPIQLIQPDGIHAANGLAPVIDKPSGVVSSLPRSLQPTQHPLLVPDVDGNGEPMRLTLATEVDSLTREKTGKMPVLSHLLSVGNGRVLGLAADDRYIYAGCQSADNEITVFSRTSLQPMYRLLGHSGSILALLVISDKKWLISSSSAGDVRIWSTETLDLLYVIHPCDDTSGGIYSLAWDERDGGTLYFGSQSASIEWVNFGFPDTKRRRTISTTASSTVKRMPNGDESAARSGPSQRTGRYKPHKFFDRPPKDICSGCSTPCPVAQISRPTSARRETFSKFDLDEVNTTLLEQEKPATEFEVPAECRLAFAHYGYVYAMQIITRPDGHKWLVSGSGDSDVKIWECLPSGGITFLKQLDNLNGGVLSFAVRNDLLYAGLQDGEIVVCDLATGACIRTIEAHESDVLAMSTLGTDVYTAAADGRILRVNEEFDCTAAFKAHHGAVMNGVVVNNLKGDGWELITSGTDSYVKIWQVESPKESMHEGHGSVNMEHESDIMLYALSKLVAVPTISDNAHRESCRQGAHLLKNILSQLGASSEVLFGEQGRNPLVLATFAGQDTGKPRKRLLFYGHYDVQPATEGDWATNPWELSGRNGYLYGRGVTDNKGPIMAVACAAATLRQKRELNLDLVMIIEGEEEAGSGGFASAVREHKAKIGHVDAVLLSNSTWINEEDPCVVFGMRGVVYANLSVEGHDDNLHNGVDGGAIIEPMFDMVRVLGALSDARGVKLPGFYDSVRPETPEEISLLRDVSNASGRPLDELIRVWRQPSFSIANINSSGSANKTVIPRKVSADVSMRLVPNQDLETIVEGLKKFCKETFDSLGSPNEFNIQVTHKASWWLTSLESPYFKALESSIQDVWGVKPLKIREGGTVPTVFWLEKEFGAPCVHLPLGQSSDAGHFANERIRLLNLRNGKRVVEAYLARLADI
nr:di- and tripeptidase [Cryptococcus depauperatus CBS 7855]